MAKNLGALIGFIVVCQLAGATGAFITDASWYRALDRRSWAQQGWVLESFGVIEPIRVGSEPERLRRVLGAHVEPSGAELAPDEQSVGSVVNAGARNFSPT